MRIALDAMGGDRAPAPIVAGALQAVGSQSDITVVLVGDQSVIEPHLVGDFPRDRVETFHCSQAVGMDESPVEALRKKPDNSISRCWQLMAEKKVEAVVSAGNTGAMVAGGLRLRRFLKNVKRPGIATLMPTAKGPCIIMDVGANVHPKPAHLFQYGVMGTILARHVLERPNPSIGLMNIGEEEGKGHNLAQETHELFMNSPLKERFIGNIEGRDIHRGVCDVVVTDGFVGNVILKLCEGVFDFIMNLVARDVVGVLKDERPLAAKSLQDLVSRFDHNNFGGAPLLGIDGICMICHGSSGEVAIRNAIVVAAQYARNRLNEKIVQELESLPSFDDE